jgi:protein tyrosine phosphatase (PTP) superfamily phosphohydrolase (DUF442 family)
VFHYLTVPEGASAKKRFRFTLRAAVMGCVLGLFMAVAVEAIHVTLGLNFHVVEEGRCYRCAQPSGDDLRHLVRTYGIRTVLNLRGPNPKAPWYQEEREAARELGVTFLDLEMDGCHPPFAQELQAMVDTLDKVAPPILMHCCSGGDRSGLVSVSYLLLRTNTDLAQARRQLSLRFGHNSFGNAACHDRLFAQYAGWLHDHGVSHTPDQFRTWAKEHYRRPLIANPGDPAKDRL